MPPPNGKKRSWGLILFSLPFAAVGIGLLVFSIIPTFYDVLRMSSWPSTQAELVFAELDMQRSSKSTTYLARARYSYQINGVYYTNDRVAISKRSDNIGSFQEDLGYRLEAAFAAKKPIEIWYNPKDPQDSIIDRSLRARLLFFNLIFVVVFGGAGIGLLLFAWRQKDAYVPTHKGLEAPWLNYPAWADNKIRSAQKSKVKFTWFFAGIWNALALPLSIFVVPENLARGNYVVLVALIFPIVGLGLLRWAIKTTADFRRYGDPVLVLDPFPGSIGGDFGGCVEIACTQQAHFNLTLTCLNVKPNYGSDNETLETPIWQIEGASVLIPTLRGGALYFRFSIPDHLPSSEPPQSKHNYIKWRLDIECAQIEPQFSRQYDVPVFATGQTARFTLEDAQQHPMMAKQQAADTQNALNIAIERDGVLIKRGYGHNARSIAPLLLFGVVFIAVGSFFLHVGAPVFLPYIFILIGSVAAAGCLHSLLHKQTVRISADGIKIEKNYLGVFSVRQFIQREKIHYLALKQSYSTQHQGKYKTFYKLQACLVMGKPVPITGSIPGEAAANYWLEQISQHTGIRVQ